METMEETPSYSRWSRAGLLQFSWAGSETFDRLIQADGLRDKLFRWMDAFAASRDSFQRANLTWRRGAFFFGPSGSGKSTAARAVAQRLGLSLITIPAHEILDSHLLERALSAAVVQGAGVVLLEDVDRMIKTMEPEVFFTLLDHAQERAPGFVWISTSRHPDETPKTQLIRPGRMDESFRFELPGASIRDQLLQLILPDLLESEEERLRLSESTEALSFAHFQELRILVARLRAEGRESELFSEVDAYVQDQIISGDRWGAPSDASDEVSERVRQMDPRVLMAALQQSDVFRILMQKVIGDAAERAATE